MPQKLSFRKRGPFGPSRNMFNFVCHGSSQLPDVSVDASLIIATRLFVQQFIQGINKACKHQSSVLRGEPPGTRGFPHNDGILPKGPYPPCLRMADRALLAGYPRFQRDSNTENVSVLWHHPFFHPIQSSIWDRNLENNFNWTTPPRKKMN